MEFGNRTINAARYGAVLDRLKDSIRQKRPGLWQPDVTKPHLRNVWFHHDNARPHTANSTAVKLADYQWVPHPPYSLDLAPCDFFLFPFLKRQMRGIQFNNVEEAQAEARRILRATPKETFRKAITEDLPACWQKCIDAEGHYFEGDVAPGPESDSSETDSDSSDDD